MVFVDESRYMQLILPNIIFFSMKIPLLKKNNIPIFHRTLREA